MNWSVCRWAAAGTRSGGKSLSKKPTTKSKSACELSAQALAAWQLSLVELYAHWITMPDPNYLCGWTVAKWNECLLLHEAHCHWWQRACAAVFWPWPRCLCHFLPADLLSSQALTAFPGGIGGGAMEKHQPGCKAIFHLYQQHLPLAVLPGGLDSPYQPLENKPDPWNAKRQVWPLVAMHKPFNWWRQSTQKGSREPVGKGKVYKERKPSVLEMNISVSIQAWFLRTRGVLKSKFWHWVSNLQPSVFDRKISVSIQAWFLRTAIVLWWGQVF